MNSHLIGRDRFIRFEASIYLVLLLTIGSACGAADAPADTAPPFPAVTGPYFGQTPPGQTPQIFAPGILSRTNRLEGRIAFSPDGNECFFSVWGTNYSSAKIYWTKCVNNLWTPQVEAPFSVGHNASGPFFSSDGNRLYFHYANYRGAEPYEIWTVQRTSQGWSEPKHLPPPINSDNRDGSYSETADGIAYFASNRPGGYDDKGDIWRTRQVPGQPLQAENLGAIVNSSAWDADPSVAPDGSYLIFTSERPGGIGGSDLYVSFPNGNGGWTAPVNLNNYCPGINIAGYANVSPSLSPDGRFLFFTRYTRTATGEQEDVYWVENPFREPTTAKSAEVTGPYFGQPPPGETPEVFAPELLSARYGFVARLAFSPDGTECYFTVTDATFSHPKILGTRRTGDIWSEPVIPDFANPKWINHEPFFSRDGTRLYFTSNRDAQPATNKRDFWMVERTPQGWSEPKRLPPPINSDFTEFFFSQAADETAYCCSDRPGGIGALDLYRVRQEPGQPARAENLGAPVNTKYYTGDPCIAPDGRCLVFAAGRPDGRGGMDLYVSFDNGQGGWTVPVNLGLGFNTPADEYAPALSPDGQFLFFARHNGKRCDVMWVRADVLERFRTNHQP